MIEMQGDLFETETEAQDGEFVQDQVHDDVEDVEPSDDYPEDVSIDGVDPDELPPELQDQYKEMLRGMHSKYQEWSAKNKDLQQSADMLNKIISDPQARKVFLASVGAMGGEAPAEQQQGQSSFDFNRHRDVDYGEVLNEEAVPAIKALVGDYLNEVLAPQAQAMTKALEMLLGDRQSQAWTSIENEFPGAADYRAQAEQLSRQTGLSLKQALFAVSEGKLQAKAPAQSGKPKPSKPVSLTKQSGPPASRVTPKKGATTPNFADEVRNEMKRLGIKPLGW